MEDCLEQPGCCPSLTGNGGGKREMGLEREGQEEVHKK